VKIKNIKTNKIIEFYSIIEFARQWNITRNEAYLLIGRHKTIPYKGKWIFIIEENSFGRVIRKNSKEIMAYDLVEKRWIITSSLKEMTTFTGINPSSIMYSVNNRIMMAGYVFRKYKDIGDLPDCKKEEAVLSRKTYLNKKKVKRKKTFFIKDYTTGEVDSINVKKELNPKINLKYGHILDCINKEKNTKIKIHRGFAFKSADDERDWPIFTKEEIEKSKTR
jgi:hypothetical protein